MDQKKLVELCDNSSCTTSSYAEFEIYVAIVPAGAAILQGSVHVGGNDGRPSRHAHLHQVHSTEILGRKLSTQIVTLALDFE